MSECRRLSVARSSQLLAVYQGPGGLLQANHHFVLFYDPDTNDIVPVYYQMGQGGSSEKELGAELD